MSIMELTPSRYGRGWLPRPLQYCADLDRTPDELRAYNAIRPKLRIHRPSDCQKPDTVDAYVRHVCLWFNYADLHDLNAEHPTADDLAAFLEALIDSGTSKATAQHVATAVHEYNYTRENPHLDSRRLRLVNRKIRKRPQPDVAVATHDQVLRMLDAASCQSGLRRYRDRALIALLWTSWLRASEMERLAVEWCEFLPDGVIIYIPDSKTDQIGEGQDVTIACNHHGPVCPVCALKEWLARAKIKSGRVWCKVDRWGLAHTDTPVGHDFASDVIKEYCRLLRLKRIYGTHAFRRGGPTYARKLGVPEYKIQRQLRHKSRRSTEIYIHNVPVEPRDSLTRSLW